MRRDMAELWALPEVMTPLANVSYVSVTCDVDRLKGVDRAGAGSRNANGSGSRWATW